MHNFSNEMKATRLSSDRILIEYEAVKVIRSSAYHEYYRKMFSSSSDPTTEDKSSKPTFDYIKFMDSKGGK